MRRAASVLVALAAAAGTVLRFAPAVIGTGLLAYGAWLIYRPAAFIVVGVAFILLDRRIP